MLELRRLPSVLCSTNHEQSTDALHGSSRMPRLSGQSSFLIRGVIPVLSACPPVFKEVLSSHLCGVDGSFPTTGPWHYPVVMYTDRVLQVLSL